MGQILNDKDIAVPGELIAEGAEFVSSYGTRKVDDKILANRLGVVSINNNTVKLIQLNGIYLPKVNDTVVVKVTEILMSGWRVDTNSPYSAVLSLKEASNEFIPKGTDLKNIINFGDFCVTKIVNVTGQNLVDVSMKGPGLRKLRGGRIVRVSCNKVPRIIGKNGSMISLIKDATKCRIIVGQNGVVWILGEPEDELFATKVIEKIEKESHIPGLTDKIKKMLEDKYGEMTQVAEDVAEDEQDE